MYDQYLALNGLRVLVVDSDLDSRDLLTMVFEEYGVETSTATSASEALAILKQVKPDLLISEICLPKEDGYSLMSKVKAFESAEQVQIPAIALTTYASKGDRACALSVGFCNYLLKPFEIDELIAIVAYLTEHVQLKVCIPPAEKPCGCVGGRNAN
ncbi:MAG: response regulator [Aphanothece sp. CMT-3BRIN-NPC111]|jgi:CheY-like chemotaxis protein|nr:response regulator [Aphanothece sp. CMT-3BRIN-NPC111]